MISTALISAGAPAGYRIGSPATVVPVDRMVRTSGCGAAACVVGRTVSAMLALNDTDSPSSRPVANDGRARQFRHVQNFIMKVLSYGSLDLIDPKLPRTRLGCVVL